MQRYGLLRAPLNFGEGTVVACVLKLSNVFHMSAFHKALPGCVAPQAGCAAICSGERVANSKNGSMLTGSPHHTQGMLHLAQLSLHCFQQPVRESPRGLGAK